MFASCSIRAEQMHTCAFNTLQIFSRVFEFALAEFCAKCAKINVPRIFPLLQYLVVNVRIGWLKLASKII